MKEYITMSDSNAAEEQHEHPRADAYMQNDNNRQVHDHDRDHPHDHDHDHDHNHDHGQSHAPLGWLIDAVPFLHGHSHGEANIDRAMETSTRGIWALKVSLVGLLI